MTQKQIPSRFPLSLKQAVTMAIGSVEELEETEQRMTSKCSPSHQKCHFSSFPSTSYESNTICQDTRGVLKKLLHKPKQ